MATAYSDFDSVNLLDDDEDCVNGVAGNGPSKDVDIEAVAAKLLKDNLVLTALELHTELTEGGRELILLRDYFSNPVHFEQPVQKSTLPPAINAATFDAFPPPMTQLSRSNSVQTFESLEFSRFSDDGEKQRDERIAVLEFELRKAKDSIKSLRSQITSDAATTGNADSAAKPQARTSPRQGPEKSEAASASPMKEHEKRAINFLVNEFLLQANCKLAAITLADENDGNQDLDDWDDVCLNVPRPAPLLGIFRGYMSGGIRLSEDAGERRPDNLVDAEMQTQMDGEAIDRLVEDVEEKEKEISRLRHDLIAKDKEIDDALAQNKRLQKEIASIMKEDGGSRSRGVSAVSLTTVSVEEKDEGVENEAAKKASLKEEVDETDAFDSTSATLLHLNPTFKRSLMNAVYPDIFDENARTTTTTDAATPTEADDANLEEEDGLLHLIADSLPNVVPNVLLAKRGDVVSLIIATIVALQDSSTAKSRASRDRLLNTLFNLVKKPDLEQRQQILKACRDYAKLVGPVCVEVEFLPQCWEQIGHKYEERRVLVAEACGLLCPYLSQQTVTSLLLSIVQNLINDKSVLVRVAAVKSLAVAWTFVDTSDKYSTGLNLLLASLNTSSPSTVKSAALDLLLPTFALWTMDHDGMFENLVGSLVSQIKTLLKDLPSPPASLGVESGLGGSLGSEHRRPSKPSENSRKVEVEAMALIEVLRALTPFVFLHVVTGVPEAVDDGSAEDDAASHNSSVNSASDKLTEHRLSFPHHASTLFDLHAIFGGGSSMVVVGDKIRRLHALIDAGDECQGWATMEWFNLHLQDVFGVCHALHPCHGDVLSALAAFFHDLCLGFGETFARMKIVPDFLVVMGGPQQRPDADLSSPALFIPRDLEHGSLPVYVIGVYNCFNPAGSKSDSLFAFLQDVVIQVSTKSKSLDAVVATCLILQKSPATREILVNILRENIVHVSHSVRISSAAILKALIKGFDDAVLSSHILPALITLASDSDVRVRIAAIPAFGAVLDAEGLDAPRRKDVVERVLLQFQAFLGDPIFRDNLPLQVQVLRTFADVGPKSDAFFREEFLLPRLAALAAENNSLSLTAPSSHGIRDRKTEIALALLEAYSAVSNCGIQTQLLRETMLPGLKCLKEDIKEVAPQYENMIMSMMAALESTAPPPSVRQRGTSSPFPTSLSTSALSSSTSSSSAVSEDVKSKILKGFHEGSKFLSRGKK